MRLVLARKPSQQGGPGPALTSSGFPSQGRFLWHLVLLLVAGGVLLVWRLGVPGLMDPDEGRYAEIAREMLLLQDWLIPHLNLLPYLEKPPLVYWLTALSMAAFGLTEGAARLIPALSGLGGILWAYFFARALWGSGPALWGALVLATCGGYVVMGRLLTLDMTLALFLNLGIGLGYLALSRPQPRLWPWAWLALALAVLTKGPVALVLATLIWGLWTLLDNRPRRQLWPPPQGVPLLAGLTLPWFLYVSWRYPEFVSFFLWEQHLARFLTAAGHHHQPFYFFVPVLAGLMLPWSFLMPWLVARLQPRTCPHHLFLLLWAGVIFLFFSLSRGKLAPYILPALMPLAVLCGERLHQLVDGAGNPPSWRGLSWSLGLWAIAAWMLLVLYFWPPAALLPLRQQAAVLSPVLLHGLVILALTPILTLLFQRKVCLLAGALLLGLLLPAGVEKISHHRSPKALAASLTAQWQPGAALVGLKLYSQALSFYSREVFHLLVFPTELDFGRRLAPDAGLFFHQGEELAAFATSRPRVFFFLKNTDVGFLYQCLPGDYQVLGRYKNCLLLSYKAE